MNKKDKDIICACFLLLAVVCDAVRDAFVTRQAEWWTWHIIKWISFYTPYVIILLRWKEHEGKLAWIGIAVFAFISLILWKVTYWLCTMSV